MIKVIKKIGNSKGIIFDAALLDMAHLSEGDQLSVTVHDGGTIVLTPMAPTIGEDEASATAKDIITQNDELFKRLSQ